MYNKCYQRKLSGSLAATCRTRFTSWLLTLSFGARQKVYSGFLELWFVTEKSCLLWLKKMVIKIVVRVTHTVKY